MESVQAIKQRFEIIGNDTAIHSKSYIKNKYIEQKKIKLNQSHRYASKMNIEKSLNINVVSFNVFIIFVK